MSKRIIIVAVVVLVLVGGGLYVANQQSQQAEQEKMIQEKTAMETDGVAMEKEDDAMQKDESVMELDKMMANKSGSYVEYSKATLDQAASNRRVLFFYASWCPTCRPTDADFRANTSQIPGDVTVIRVNFNDPETDQEEKNLAKQYGITYQHTFVQIDSSGKEVTKWNGGALSELLANIK